MIQLKHAYLRVSICSWESWENEKYGQEDTHFFILMQNKETKGFYQSYKIYERHFPHHDANRGITMKIPEPWKIQSIIKR